MTAFLTEDLIRRAMSEQRIPNHIRPAILDLMLGKTPSGKPNTPWTVASKHNVSESDVQASHSAVLDIIDREWIKAGRP